MRRIIKDEAPEFWIKYIRKNPKITYKKAYQTEPGREVIDKIREHMVSQQKFICCYCCSSLPTKNKQYHNEHIKPQSRYPQVSMDYNNLLVSCNSSSCGKSKEDDYDEGLFVSPLQENCEAHFRYQRDGYIVGVTKQGKYTIMVLNLNCPRLVEERMELYNNCCRMAECGCAEYIEEEYITEKDGRLPRYVNMVKYFFDKGEFEALSPNN